MSADLCVGMILLGWFLRRKRKKVAISENGYQDAVHVVDLVNFGVSGTLSNQTIEVQYLIATSKALHCQELQDAQESTQLGSTDQGWIKQPCLSFNFVVALPPPSSNYHDDHVNNQ